MSEDEKVLRVLKKLEELRKRGLIDEQYYQEKRRLLLSKYLESEEERYFLEKHHASEKSRYRSIFLPVLIACIVVLGIMAVISVSPYIKPVTNTVTVILPTYVTATEIRFVGGNITLTRTQTIIAPTVASENTNRPFERVIYSGSLTLEKNCQINGFTINANKGDVIRVYWESNDDSTYVAIGSDAHLERNRQYYCEVMIPVWRYIWPAADYGYSGHLQFTVPSSGTWYVMIANGNWGCVFSNCPITVTKLEIIHAQS